ncbi:MAG: hypothetical protein R3F65_26255 [bacterium]
MIITLTPADDPAERLARPLADPALDPLTLRVCDPHLEDGARLLAAGERIARRLDAPLPEARRRVATRCLYGIDPARARVTAARAAIERWATTQGAPPISVDHNIRRGDLALGFAPAQLAAFHVAPAAAQPHPRLDRLLAPRHATHRALRAAAIDAAPHDAARARAALARADAHNDTVRLIGDALAALTLGDRAARRPHLLALVTRWQAGDPAAEAELRAVQTDVRQALPTFHWIAEFSELYPAPRWDAAPREAA